jgi:hypothetical protein
MRGRDALMTIEKPRDTRRKPGKRSKMRIRRAAEKSVGETRRRSSAACMWMILRTTIDRKLKESRVMTRMSGVTNPGRNYAEKSRRHMS